MTPVISAILIVPAVLAVLLIAEIWRELHSFKVTRYTVESGKLPESGDGLRIVFLSQICITGNMEKKMNVCIRRSGQSIRI